MLKKPVKTQLNKKNILKTLKDLIKINWDVLKNEENDSDIYKKSLHKIENTDEIIVQLKRIMDLQGNQVTRPMLQQLICEKKVVELQQRKNEQTQTGFDEKLSDVGSIVAQYKCKCLYVNGVAWYFLK